MIGRVVLTLAVLALPAQAQLLEGQVEQSTQGWCSPAIADTNGNVTIVCNGVGPRALDRLNELLNKKDLELAQKVREAENWARRYRELMVQVTELGETGPPAREAKAALEEGELETAGALLFNDYYNLGNTYHKEKKYHIAVLNYEQAIKSLNLTGTHDHFGAEYNLADSYRKIGDVERAIEHFQNAVKIKPNNPEVNYNIAITYQQNGEYDLAKKYYLRVMELEQEGSGLWNRTQDNLRSLER